MKAACSLIVATYNWPQALNLCLQSVLQQSVLPWEIIIADDGSDETTTELVKKFEAVSPVPLVHVWHPDKGFQLAKIRNRAIAKASQPYIIQIDGDLILHRHFIKDHLHLSEAGYFISGSRVLLSPETTITLIKNEVLQLDNIFNGSKNFFNRLRSVLLRRLLSKRYKISGRHTYYVKGCNMSFWKKDLIRVNGYNEAFTGWGREDSEIAIRLINAGVKKKFLKMGGITYHLYHKEASRELEPRNVQLMEDAIRNKKLLADKGLSQYV